MLYQQPKHSKLAGTKHLSDYYVHQQQTITMHYQILPILNSASNLQNSFR